MDAETSSFEVRPTMLLSSLVHTCSIELVLAPIAIQVSQLIILSETRDTPFPNLEPGALSVMDAVQNLANVAQKIITETADEKLQTDLPVAYTQAASAGQQLVEGARRLAEDPTSREAPVLLHTAARGILEGTMKVLLVWDEGEVRKIVRAAHWTLDRLGLVKVAKSMRSLVICFGGLSEAMMLLLSLADKRKKELTDPGKRENVHSALNRLKTALPLFSEAMKNYVKNPSDTTAQNTRNNRAGEISSAIYDLIAAVKPFHEEEDEESTTDNMATKIMEVQRQLAPDNRYFIGGDLDKNLVAIRKNSTAVAHVSRDPYQSTIERLCRELVLLRQELGENIEAVTRNPESMEARSAFDQTADQLCEKLCEIDRWVADAVVDQVTEAFVEPSAPIQHLVQAAAAGSTSHTSISSDSFSSSPVISHHESDALTKQAELFRRHSQRLSQVAAHAAQSSADSKRVQQITELASQVDQLMPQVLEAAVAMKTSPVEMEAKLKFDACRKEWTDRVKQLTAAIDDIIDPEDFMAVSEANIYQDMTGCRDAISAKNWPALRSLVQRIAAKAKRVAEIAGMAADQAKEPQRKWVISTAVKRLNNAIPQMVSLGSKVVTSPDHQQPRDQFAASLKEVLDSIHQIQTALKSTGTAAGVEPVPPAVTTSTPISVPLERKEKQQQQPGPLGVSPVPFSFPPSPPPPPPPPPPPLSPPAVKQARYIGSLKPWGARRRKQGLHTGHPESEDQTNSGAAIATPPRSGRYTRPTLTGDAQTQTPHTVSRDQGLQADMHPTSGSSGSDTSTLNFPPPPPPPEKEGGRREAARGKSDSPTHRAVQSYASSLQKLVSVAQEGQVDSLQSHAKAFHDRSVQLARIAGSAAGAVRHNTGLMKVLQVKMSEVKRLTPRVIEHAEGLVQDPQETQRLQELQMSSHQWAGHVRQLIEATQKANYPWSKTADRLVAAARKGEGLDEQMRHVSTQTSRMVDVAETTVKAAKTEDAIGSGDDSEVSQDPELKEQISRVQVTASQIEELVPQLLTAAEMAATGPSPATMEHLNLLSQEWATKAKVLMHRVDDISLGISGPADTLLLSSRAGDPLLLSEQSKSLTELASSLHSIAEDAMEGCKDEKKCALVRSASDRISRVSAELIECANKVAEIGGQDDGATKQQLEALQNTLENTELLRRDWTSQVHLITAHIDELIAKVSAPLDQLVEVALQASRTSSHAKHHLMDKFETRASFIIRQLEVVERCFKEASDTVERREKALDEAAMAINLLRKLTPHAINACHALSSGPGSALLEHFGHLRRQWASKAQKLLTCLKRVTGANMEEVLAAFDELIHQPKSGRTTPGAAGSLTPAHRSYSYEDIEEEDEETGDVVMTSKLDPSYMRYSAADNPHSSQRSKPDSHTSYSDTDDTPSSRKSKLDPHKRYSATDNLMSSRQVVEASRRPTSMAVPLPSWMEGGSIQESHSSSSLHIAAAAKRLEDVTNEFQEKDNELISVAKKMSEQMSQMAEFSCGRGELQTKAEMINTAKAIAANGQAIVQFAHTICEQCIDARMRRELEASSQMIPTLSTQLRIIASVKACTPDDASADVMLVKNAQNLMSAVVRTIRAAEAACMRGMKSPQDQEQMKAVNLAKSWKRKLYYHRTLEAIVAPLGARGLRKLNRSHISSPSLVDTIQQST